MTRTEDAWLEGHVPYTPPAVAKEMARNLALEELEETAQAIKGLRGLAPVCEHVGAPLVVDVCGDGIDASGWAQFAEFI